MCRVPQPRDGLERQGDPPAHTQQARDQRHADGQQPGQQQRPEPVTGDEHPTERKDRSDDQGGDPQ
jgi:hypothetical protein